MDAKASHCSGWHNLIIHTDASCSHGSVGIGYVIQNDGETYQGKGSYEGGYTSMEAEFLALKEAAIVASHYLESNEHIYFYTDCRGLIEKMEEPNGCDEWNARRDAFLDILSEGGHRSKWSVKWVPRERNGEADALARTARDST